MPAEHIALIGWAVAVAPMLVGDETHQADTVVGQFGNIVKIGEKARKGKSPILVIFGGFLGFGGCFCWRCLRPYAGCAHQQAKAQGKTKCHSLVPQGREAGGGIKNHSDLLKKHGPQGPHDCFVKAVRHF